MRISIRDAAPRRAPTTPTAAPQTRHLAAGEPLCVAGTHGPIWAVQSGLLRLDHQLADGEQFALLALPGDLIGLEQLLASPYRYSVRALQPCVLTSVEPSEELQRQQLLGDGLLQLQQRTADLLALRSGPVVTRLQRLLAMLAELREGRGDAPPRLRLKDIAAIVDATQERICRLLGELRGGPGALAVGA